MTSRRLDLDDYVLNWLLKNLPQDSIWQDMFEDRLKKLEQKKLVKKCGNLWVLTAQGGMIAAMQEEDFP